jgi:hypothetical protein
MQNKKVRNNLRMYYSKTEARKLPMGWESWGGGTTSPVSILAPSNYWD